MYVFTHYTLNYSFSISFRIFKDNMIESGNSVKPFFLKITFQHWFQNRRAKSRKEEAHSASIQKTNPSSQFGPPVRRFRMESWQPRRPRFPVSHARHLEHEFLTVQSNRSDQLYQTSPATVNHPSAFKSTQFTRCRSFQLPMFHPDQFKFRPVAKAARLPFRQGFHRYKPYQ